MQKDSFHRIHYISRNFKNESLAFEETKAMLLFMRLKVPKPMHVSRSRSCLQ